MNTLTAFAAFAVPFALGLESPAPPAPPAAPVVPGNYLKDSRGYLGVSIQDMSGKIAKSMNVKTEEGALVNDVTKDSPADKAGIEEKDIIVEFDGKTIGDADDLTKAVRATKPDTKVRLTVVRKDQKKVMDATIGEVEEPEVYAFSYRHPHPPRAMRWHFMEGEEIMGMSLMELNEQLGEYFGAPNNRGVLVREVEKDGEAAAAGVKAGDVIVRAGKREVQDVDDFYKALRQYDEGEKIPLEVMRKGTKLTLPVEVSEANEFESHTPMPDVKLDSDIEFEIDDQLRQELDLMNEELEKIQPKIRDITREAERRAREALNRAIMVKVRV